MKVSYKWLQTYFDKPLPEAERLSELFSAHAFEVEGMEKVGGDTALDIKILPDRSHYALSHRGIAREAAAVTGLIFKDKKNSKVSVDASVKGVEVKVEDDSLCPRYMARRIDGIRVSLSPKWLKDSLEAIGARSINSIVDSTNFVMFDVGQPLHAFDADRVKGTIVVRRAKEGEAIELLPEKVTLDGQVMFKERYITLSQADIVIADDEGPLVIAGVKGGKRAEVTDETTSVIIEAANFNPASVRRTSGKYNLRNDSSKRFENEITSALAEEALNRVTALILELSKGAKAGAATDAYPRPVKPWSIKADVAYMNSVTGLNLSADDMKEILSRLACEVSVKGDALTVVPPLDRLDIRIPEDVADEIGRMKGYADLSSVDTPDVPPVQVDKTFYWAEKAKDVLVSLGFSETLLYTLVPKGAYEISYPLASDKSALREKISGKISESLVFNSRNADLLGLETIKIFEIGKIFPKSGEKTSLSIGVSQAKKKKGVTAESVLKEALASLEKSLGVPLSAKIEQGPYGAMTEIDFDAVVSKLPAAGSIRDLSFKPLPKNLDYKTFSMYPFIVRDIALFVDATVADAEVKEVIHKAAHEASGALLVKGPDLFDRFDKGGRVSYGFRMIFQSFEKTLSDEEVNGFMAALYRTVAARGWEVR